MSPLSRPTATGPLVALLAAGALLLGACGSSGSDGTASTSTTAAGATTTEDEGTATTEATDTSEPDTTEPDTSDPDPTETTSADPTPTPTGDEDAYVAAVEEAIAESLSPIEADQASCIAEDWVATIGFDRLDGAVEPGGLGRGDESAWKVLEVDDDEADALYAIVEDCGYDFPSAIRASITTGEDPQKAACLNDELTDELIASFMKSSFQGNSSDSELMQVGETCE